MTSNETWHYFVYHRMVKKGHFSETRLTRASSFPKRTNWESRGNRVSNRFLLSLRHASVILLPNSAWPPPRRGDAVRRRRETGDESTRRSDRSSQRSFHSRVQLMRATLLERAGVSRPVNETRRKRPTLFPLFLFADTYSPLSKSVLSPLCICICGGDRLEDGAVPIFFFFLFFFSSCLFTLLYRLPFGLSVSGTYSGSRILHLFNPEKENVESIFFK